MPQAISFYLGDESQLVIDSFETKHESIFNDSYDKVLKEISEYVKQNSLQKAKGKDSFYSQTADVYVNNIFAFVGDRGTGKSSCMFSVANMLKDDFLSKKAEGCGAKFELKNGFEILENIDPSFFDEKTNILSLVLGRLFSNFKKAVDNGLFAYKEGYEYERDELFKQFQEVKKSLTSLFADNKLCEEDSVEELVNLTASVDLRNTLTNLLNLYLKFFKKDFLVIPIDDIDLHTQCAYKMVEELRKYLRQEKVIILMALKLNQLQQVIEREFLSRHREMLDKKMMSESDIIDMASKYLIKLIPEKNRIYLPTVSVWVDAEVNVYKRDLNGSKVYREEKWTLVNANDKEDESSGRTIKYYVLSLIFQKTRYLFYSTKGEISPIIPFNLRELRGLIASLNEMNDYTHDAQGDYNKSLFKEYFFNTWAIENLTSSGISFIKELFGINNPSLINKTVVRKLYTFYIEQFVKQKEFELNKNENVFIDEELQRILNVKNVSYNISLGDVLYVLSYLKARLNRKEDKMLIFAIESFYSIRLYEYYDLITETRFANVANYTGCFDRYNEKDKSLVNSDIDRSIKRRDVLDGLSAYEILIGENVYNPEQGSLITESKKQGRRDYRKINYKTLRTEFAELAKASNKDDLWASKLQIVEFFVLTSCRNDYTKKKIKGFGVGQTRQLNEVLFASSLSSEEIQFDIMSLFSNISSIKRQYLRFDFGSLDGESSEENESEESKLERIEGPSLLQIAKANKGSLYNKLKNLDEETATDESRFLSKVCVRNIEILNDLLLVLKCRRSKRKTNKNTDLFLEFFEELKKYEISTYDRDENRNPRSVVFKFADVFYEMFENMKVNSLSSDFFDDIFDCVYKKKCAAEEGNLRIEVEKYAIQTPELRKFVVKCLQNETGRRIRQALLRERSMIDKSELELLVPNGKTFGEDEIESAADKIMLLYTNAVKEGVSK